MKALLGHLVAAKVDIENTLFDQQAREYVLDINAPLPAEINIFYWVYPHDCSVTIRDFGCLRQEAHSKSQQSSKP